MLSGSGAVRNVVVSQTTVVTATVMIIRQAVAFGASPRTSAGAGRPSQPSLSNMNSDITKLDDIALISDQALMRHQYQRRISTSPVPAPNASSSSHAFSTELRCIVTRPAARKSPTVVQRETVT